jgi:hypothetical protein
MTTKNVIKFSNIMELIILLSFNFLFKVRSFSIDYKLTYSGSVIRL